MSSVSQAKRLVKPAVCESTVIRHPLAPCEILPAGLEGVLEINGVRYVAQILGYLPEEAEPVVDGFRLTKDTSEAHDVCLVAGRFECTCGDWIWRRAAQVDRELADCKHCVACRRHFAAPVDQHQPQLAAAGFDDVDFDHP